MRTLLASQTNDEVNMYWNTRTRKKGQKKNVKNDSIFYVLGGHVGYKLKKS